MSEIFLDERIKNFLERFFSPETKPVQSLLFYGEENIGKKTIALAFAKGLLCQETKKSFNGCAECQNCLMFDKGLHPDFHLLEPFNNNIAIESVRQAIEFLYYKPQLSSWRLLIVDQADRLEEDAQNTLLKTIEEPPPHTLIIFITAHPQKLLPTVLSRLLPVRFHHAPLIAVAQFLATHYDVDITQAQELAQLSHGKIGLAIKLLDQNYLEDLKTKQQSLKTLLNSDFMAQSKYLQSLCEDKGQVISTLKNWLDSLNAELSLSFNFSHLKFTRELLKAFYLISDSNINSRLLLENIFLNYAH